MRENFERYVDQITQSVIAFLNIWKIQTRISENQKIASRCRIAPRVSGPLLSICHAVYNDVSEILTNILLQLTWKSTTSGINL
jgi:hypothetical protein